MSIIETPNPDGVAGVFEHAGSILRTPQFVGVIASIFHIRIEEGNVG